MENKKKPLGKKILKWSLITLLVLIIGLFSVPFLFKDKIVEMVSNTINNNINATVPEGRIMAYIATILILRGKDR